MIPAMIVGAVLFAAGCIFGAAMVVTGERIEKKD